jgi:phage terminase large subunit-like protein
VYLPTEANWRAAYLHELNVFPYGKHDDQADSTSQALDWAMQYPARLPMGEFHE